MILLVFEGTDAEPKIFDSIGKLFLSDEELCIVRCGFDLPTLYSRLNKYGEDLFRCLPLEKNGIVVPEGRRLDTLFSQIFLFFDYDFQNRMGLKKLNDILKEMLTFFSNETENGRLYINYPMVESLKLQNVKKANYIISGNDAMPDSKDTVNQKKIFNAQIEQYVEPKEQVSILNSFPIFVYDYLKE